MQSFKTFLIQEESIIGDLSQFPDMAKALRLAKEIEKLKPNSTALLVGGAVRDFLLGKSPKDVDIATNVPIQLISKHFKTHDIGKSKDFGLVVVLWEDEPFEVANFRKDGTYSDSRRPDSVEIVDRYDDDAARRDFTFNAMAITTDGELIDLYGGLNDLKANILKTVGDARMRFSEDALRILRSARFAARMGLTIDDSVREAMTDLAKLVGNMSGERIRDEMIKAAGSGVSLAKYIEILDETGVLSVFLPEVSELKKFEHNPIHHPEGNVWQHTLAAVRQSRSKDPIDNIAVLLHDIGKAVTYVDKEGRPTYYGHEQAGLGVFDKIFQRLKFSNDQADAIKLAISEHMHGHKMDELSDKTVLRLRQHPKWETLKNTIYSDEASRLHLWDPKQFEDKMARVEVLYKQLGDKAELERKFSELIDGRKIMALVPGISGKEIGRIKDAVRDEILKRKFDITSQEVEDLVKSLI